MTPLECAQGLAEFFRGKLVEYSEKTETKQEYKVYAGYLPYVQTRQEKKELCPAVVVRPLEVNDEEKESTILMGIYVTTYDEDMKVGCYELYHILEFLRYQLLTENPVADKWLVKNGTLSTSVPDDQPYPQWWGRLDFIIYIPQPKRVVSSIYER